MWVLLQNANTYDVVQLSMSEININLFSLGHKTIYIIVFQTHNHIKITFYELVKPV